MTINLSLNKQRRYWMALACAGWLRPALSAGVKRQPWLGKTPVLTQELTMQSGGVWSLSELKGRPLLLNFWASWCEPCRNEMPSLEQLAKRHAARGLQVVAVNYRESESTVQRFIDATSLGLPVVRDNGQFAKAFDVHIFPNTVAINRKGDVVFTVVGECDWNGPSASRWVEEIL